MIETLKRMWRTIILTVWPQLLFISMFAVVIVVSIFLLEYNNVVLLNIDINIVVSFLKYASTISGTMGAIMIGFFIFRFQSLESTQASWYLYIKERIDQLVQILHNLPDKYLLLCQPLDDCIRCLESKKINSDPFLGEDELEIIHKPYNITYDNNDISDIDKDIYLMIQSILRIEEAYNRLQINWVGITIAEYFFKLTIKLFAILLISLFFILFFGLLSEHYLFNKYFLLSIIVFLFSFLTILILGIIEHFNYYYVNICDIES